LEIALGKNRVYCPNPKCSQITECNKKKMALTVCQHCNFEFCGKCQVEWERHRDLKCGDVDPRIVDDEWF